MGKKISGNLMIIGGAEDKEGECEILKEFVKLSGGNKSKIIIMTTATELPEEVGRDYADIFKHLGAKDIEVLRVENRIAAEEEKNILLMASATGIFFTGGDQLRITSLLGGTSLNKELNEMFKRGIIIAGTSAGASAMSDTMIVEGDSQDAPRKNTLKMAPGLGLLEEVTIDQHFAQRGRMGRLLTAVAQNPYVLGIGIDEDTAIIILSDATFSVIGSRAVTVVDGKNIELTNVSELKPDQPLALTNVILHVLPAGYKFDLKTRSIVT